MRPSLRLTNGGLLLALALAVTACSAPIPSPSASPSPTSEPTPSPSPTAIPQVEVPLAVVTGFQNLKGVITSEEVEAAREADTLIQPCELFPTVQPVPNCLPAVEITPRLATNPTDLALLPAGLVTPAVKVLPVDGADLFGSAEARAKPYPFSASVDPGIGWAPYDVTEIRTMISPGNSCPDRGVAYAAIRLGRGWDWVFNGGTAVYNGFNAPGGVSTINIVPTGNEGAVAALMRSGDLTWNDFECPVVDNFTVNGGTIFSIDPAVLPRLRDTYGIDVITLAANHPFDQGEAGFLETLDQFAAAGLPYTGAGRNLDEALTPAFVEVNGLTFGFVAHNDILGPRPAGPDQPGVAWLTDENVVDSVARARAGADVVICVPQWWGGTEYHYDWRGAMRHQQGVYLEAGCDHILGQGTHYAGPIDFTTDAEGQVQLTIVSGGNFLFGQGWSQDTQEGVISELTFRGAELVQVRMHPYAMLDQAQINLTDPETDGHYVLQRIFETSDTTY